MTQVQNSDTNDMFPPRAFVVADPRTFDGDPYEVAERATRQAAAVAGVLAEMLPAVDKMARNAEMERAFANHEAPKGSEWGSTAQGKAYTAAIEAAEQLQHKLNVLAIAAGYNPRQPPKE